MAFPNLKVFSSKINDKYQINMKISVYLDKYISRPLNHDVSFMFLFGTKNLSHFTLVIIN